MNRNGAPHHGAYRKRLAIQWLPFILALPSVPRNARRAECHPSISHGFRASNRTGSASDRSGLFRRSRVAPALALGVLLNALIVNQNQLSAMKIRTAVYNRPINDELRWSLSGPRSRQPSRCHKKPLAKRSKNRVPVRASFTCLRYSGIVPTHAVGPARYSFSRRGQ